MDPDLYHASIYTFGYDSDWGSAKASILDVNDFGRALYEEIRLHPLLRQKPNVSIPCCLDNVRECTIHS